MLFIVNPISGQHRKARIINYLKEHNFKVVMTEYAGHAEIIAREALERTIVAVGGDGTVNEVARGIIGRVDTIEMPGLAFMLMTGLLDKYHRVCCYRGRNIKITRTSEGPAHTDGEWFTAGTELDIRVHPSSLKVLVP